MIASMTAFARSATQAQWGSLTWELRSVNHRYLEVSVRLPEALRVIEKLAREQTARVLKRGKVELNLKFYPGEDVPFDFEFNENLAKQLAQTSKQVSDIFPVATTQVVDVLNWPGVLQIKETHMQQVNKEALVLLQQALEEMLQMRCKEGEGIKDFLMQRLAVIEEQVEKVTQELPVLLKKQREKILARFEEMRLELDKDRLEQEMVWLTQKMDVAEELQRLKSHVEEVRRILGKGGVVGRRLDFLMQELNREANTLSSKSVDAGLTQAAVELKVAIEQMREQVQNVE